MIDDRLNNMETPDQKLARQYEQQNKPMQKAVRGDALKSRVRMLFLMSQMNTKIMTIVTPQNPLQKLWTQ